MSFCSLPSSRYHVLQKDENITKLSKQYSISIYDFQRFNPHTKWIPGEKVYVPFEKSRMKFTKGHTVFSKTLDQSKKQEFQKFGLVWPIKKPIITSKYGVRGHRFHEGLDISAPRHTPVFASQSGEVIYADSRISGYGRMIIIQHSESLRTVYAHLQKMVVRKGQRVQQNRIIGSVGTSGKATGPHLHYEVRNGSKAHNPLYYLPSKTSRQFAGK